MLPKCYVHIWSRVTDSDVKVVGSKIFGCTIKYGSLVFVRQYMKNRNMMEQKSCKSSDDVRKDPIFKEILVLNLNSKKCGDF